MRDVLTQVEQELPSLLSADGWDSLYIDYDYPNVSRVYREWDGYRINLHLIHALPEDKIPLYHPHPWPSAMRIVTNGYDMNVGYGPYDGTSPPVVASMFLNEGSYYEMTDMSAWHSVWPSKNVLSLMVTGRPWWDDWSPNDKELSLRKLTETEIDKILTLFGLYYKEND